MLTVVCITLAFLKVQDKVVVKDKAMMNKYKGVQYVESGGSKLRAEEQKGLRMHY